jgi:polysaccharide export outer membrane protein
MTVVQAIAIAGGRTPYAGDRVVWLRDKQGGKPEKATLSFRDLVKGEESGELWLASGDVLYVP